MYAYILCSIYMCCLRLSCVLARVPSLPSLYMPSVSNVARAQRGQRFGHRVDTRGQRSNPPRTRIRTCGQSRRNGGSPAPCVPDDGTSRSRRSAPASTLARVRRIAAQTKWFVEHGSPRKAFVIGTALTHTPSEQLCNRYGTAVINTHRDREQLVIGTAVINTHRDAPPLHAPCRAPLALPFFSPSFFHTISLSPAFISARWAD
jgi:hypothetical protein